ncbi:hypothetical protein [Paraburkholderia acidisoli]|uniref:hypothetical protein n=1 Tax=Paraburkholderia acidisoli TaxID=2571748 RepID=UPI001E496E6F|nr:hypothetical protein [Paraburkholderia acidisoli]
MNKPSERIVVFVTPAQKRAISATAEELGISLSELMRRAVIAFSATSDQVKAASIVDRLNAPRQPDALAQVLAKASKPLRAGRLARPAAAIPELDDTAPNPAPASEVGASAELIVDEARAHDAAREIAQAVGRLNAEAEAEANVEANAQNALRPALPDVPFAVDRSEPSPSNPVPQQQLRTGGFLNRRREMLEARGDDARLDDTAPEGGKFA